MRLRYMSNENEQKTHAQHIKCTGNHFFLKLHLSLFADLQSGTFTRFICRTMTSTEKDLPVHGGYRMFNPMAVHMARGHHLSLYNPAALRFNPLHLVPPSEDCIFIKGFGIDKNLELIRFVQVPGKILNWAAGPSDPS